jgi:hypothetical protein
MSGPSTTPMKNHIPNVMESKINSTEQNSGKGKTVQDIKSITLLRILNLANPMDLTMNEDLYKAFIQCKKL